MVGAIDCALANMVQLPEVHPRTVQPTERPPRAQNPDATSQGSRDNAVRLCHVEPARAPLRHAAPSPPQVLDSMHRLARTQSITPTTRFPIWTRLSRRKGRASRRLDAGGGSCLRDLWRAWRIRDCRKCVMFGELVGDAGCVRGQEKE